MITFSELLDEAPLNSILAVKHEGADWHEFEPIVYTQYSAPNQTNERLEQLKQLGYVIFIVPYENKLYDSLSKTIHSLTDTGRGEIIEKWE